MVSGGGGSEWMRGRKRERVGEVWREERERKDGIKLVNTELKGNFVIFHLVGAPEAGLWSANSAKFYFP